MNNVKFLNNVKRISKKVSTNATPANLAFSSITVRKVKRNIEKSTPDTNVRLKNFYMQEGIGFINNNSIKEDFLWKSKLYSRKRGNSYQQLQIINMEDSLFNFDNFHRIRKNYTSWRS